MDILIILIPITFGLAVLGLIAFLWSLKDKQYQDLEGEANRILFDEEQQKDEKILTKNSKKNSDKK